NYFTNGGNDRAMGLVLLALIEKHTSADFNAPVVGYNGLAGNDGVLDGTSFPAPCASGFAPPATACPTLDKALAQYAVQRIVNYNPGQSAYADGNFMMALSEYRKSGGQPNVPNGNGWGVNPSTTGTGSVKARLDAMVDRTVDAQAGGPVYPGNYLFGFWSY